MVKYILLIIIILFCVGGICEFIYYVNMFFYHPKIKDKNCFIIVLKNNFAIKQLNFYWQKIKWQGNEFSNKIIALADDIDIEEKKKCVEFVKDKNIDVCSTNDFYMFLLDFKENTNGWF